MYLPVEPGRLIEGPVNRGAENRGFTVLKFVAGHGTVVQTASINIIIGCKQAQQYSRTH